MKITIVSSTLNHGRILQEAGSSFALLSTAKNPTNDIAIVTWKRTTDTTSDLFNSAKVFEVFDTNHMKSIFGYFRLLRNLSSDIYIFNLMPTAYGNSSIANFVGLLLPIYTKKRLGRETVVMYHNSTYTNDPVKLGYTGFFNRVRYSVLKGIEKAIFTRVDTYFFADVYRETLLSKIPNAKVHTIHLPFFQVVDTIFLNGLEKEEKISIESGGAPRILLFGSWGPQKNPREALDCLYRLRKEGLNFSLTVAGGINDHFPNLTVFYDKMFKEFSSVIDRRLSYVPEKDLFELFTGTDLVIIPYNIPGGFSSVLALSVFFERHVIISDFPEYREQASDYSRVTFYKGQDLYDKLKNFVSNLFTPDSSVEVKIKVRMDAMVKEFSELLDCQFQNSKLQSPDTDPTST